MNAIKTLFDANGSFGKPATGAADFAGPAELLSRMDRLGIQRSLAWNVECRQQHALTSNEHLLDAIERTPGAPGRIVPALAISPLMLYERDGIAKFRRQFERGRTRAIRFVRVFGRTTLGQMEPALRAVLDLRPVLVMNHAEAPPEDILGLAALLPEVPIVLAESMWPAGINVFDLMSRRDNLLLEISWLHTCGNVELAVKRFGAHRVVFGSGPNSHNGAAIAALARAAISNADKDLIAHGNLDRLIGSETPADRSPGRVCGGLWRKCIAGERLGVDVVDAHGHLGPSGGYVLEDQDAPDQLERAGREMSAIGLRTMICSGIEALMGEPCSGNDRLETLLGADTDRFLGYVVFNPHYADDLVRRLDKWFGGKVFVGFKTLCDYWQVPVTDPRYDPMWEYAQRHRLPVLSHTWGGKFDSPAMFADLARKYPEVPFILGHSGGSDDGRREAEALAAASPNVYLEWCGSFCSTIRWEDTLRRVSPAQVVFGTDAMAHDIAWELGRLLSLDAPEETIAAILGANMRRILALRRQ